MNDAPSEYVNKTLFSGLKTNTAINSPSSDTYSYVLGIGGWSDVSGGQFHQLAFNNSGINHRISTSTSAWVGWEKLVTSNNYTDYAPSKTGTGASGNWGINITGSAAKLTTSRLFTVSDNDGTNTQAASSFDGSVAYTVKLPATIKANITGNCSGSSGSCTGNAATATKATQDGSGNTITSTYLNKTTSTAQTVVATTTFSGGCYGAYWNDLTDCIAVPEDTELEYGRCYCFDGERYMKSSEYCQGNVIGIHSDTSNFGMGRKDVKTLDCSVAGFVLAYVDKEYPVGTPLTCTTDGCLTEIRLEDKRDYPERILAKYWKNEPSEEWGTDDRKVIVNGRHWVKVL